MDKEDLNNLLAQYELNYSNFTSDQDKLVKNIFKCLMAKAQHMTVREARKYLLSEFANNPNLEKIKPRLKSLFDKHVENMTFE